MAVKTWMNENGRWYELTSEDGETMLLDQSQFDALWLDMQSVDVAQDPRPDNAAERIQTRQKHGHHIWLVERFVDDELESRAWLAGYGWQDSPVRCAYRIDYPGDGYTVECQVMTAAEAAPLYCYVSTDDRPRIFGTMRAAIAMAGYEFLVMEAAQEANGPSAALERQAS